MTRMKVDLNRDKRRRRSHLPMDCNLAQVQHMKSLKADAWTSDGWDADIKSMPNHSGLWLIFTLMGLYSNWQRGMLEVHESVGSNPTRPTIGHWSIWLVHPALTRSILVQIKMNQPFKIRYGRNKGSGAAVLVISCSLVHEQALCLRSSAWITGRCTKSSRYWHHISNRQSEGLKIPALLVQVQLVPPSVDRTNGIQEPI